MDFAAANDAHESYITYRWFSSMSLVLRANWNLENNSMLLVLEEGTCTDPEEHSHGCALAEPSGPWCLTFALGRLEYLIFFIQIICRAP